MQVLILSKTRMKKGRCCVGGVLNDGKSIRLLTQNGENQPLETEFNIREVWDIEFKELEYVLEQPHVEDVLVLNNVRKGVLKKEIKVHEFLVRKSATIWEGSSDNLYNGTIKWTYNGSGYINRLAIPKNSVGFWIPDTDLTKEEVDGKVYYSCLSNFSKRKFRFVGLETPIDIIPSGTLLRVSLARWWRPDDLDDSDIEERCYLQLSGWYDL